MWEIIGQTIVALWFFFHVPIIALFLYWRAFREWPFPKGYKWSDDLKFMNQVRREAFKALVTKPENDRGVSPRYYSEEDFYDIGEANADERARVRHPKNRDRAYSGRS